MIVLLLYTALIVNAHGCYDEGDNRFNRRISEYIDMQNTGLVQKHTDFSKRSQPGTFVPQVGEMRSLEWGDLNVVHVTDSHGWLSGHMNNQDSYSADWGDLVSFKEHMTAEADRRGVDLLFIESGDRHDGTGFSDSTKVDGSLSQLVFAQAPFDVVSIGNHELYKSDVALQEYNLLRPYYRERYLSSNIDIWHPTKQEWVPAGGRYRIFETRNRQYKVLAFSFIFNFNMSSNESKVTRVQEAVKQDWFQSVIRRNDLDVIIIAGHIPIRGYEEFDAVVHEIRTVKPHIPIFCLGGHSHVRDFRLMDENAAALESGRYLETIGWGSMQFKFINKKATDSQNSSQNSSIHLTPTTKFSRRYIDFNPANLAYHSNTSLNASSANFTVQSFQTKAGLAISQMVQEYRKRMDLDHVYGFIEQDYLTEWTPFMAKNSLFKLAVEKVHPLLEGNVSRNHMPRVIICNTGNYRYPLLKGPFTNDSKFIVSPFSNPWLYAKDVPIKLALKVLDHLNKDYSYIKRDVSEERLLSYVMETTTSSEIPTPAMPTSVYIPQSRKTLSSKPGYVTHDDLGDDGDDIIHQPYRVYKIPNAFQTEQNINNATKTADVVFVSFLQNKVEPFLKSMGWTGQISSYGGNYERDLFQKYFESKLKK